MFSLKWKKCFGDERLHFIPMLDIQNILEPCFSNPFINGTEYGISLLTVPLKTTEFKISYSPLLPHTNDSTIGRDLARWGKECYMIY